ncbi:MAG TPA: M14 metallopeptidase family protein [Candidatus Deferrimicrobium sp.]|nr:M14 metallopeptidase family protein [Candidatus Deferrimicrobium sp.]
MTYKNSNAKPRYFLYSSLLPFFLSFVILLMGFTQRTDAQTYQSPVEYFGFEPGADYSLFDYEALIRYLQKLDIVAERLKLVEIGKSPMGKPMYIAFISAVENIRDIDTLKTINRKLALDPNIPEAERETLFKQGKVFVLGTLSMHSEEVAPSQAVPLIAYDLVTTNDPVKLAWLKNVVYMIVPNHNPDGMDMIVNHYKKYKGSKYEGSSFPGVYHKYTGHDNNRDFVALTQSDSRAVAAIYNLDWFPQVMVDKHQMGNAGVRYFIPPPHDPIAENVDAGIWNWSALFGSNMMKDMNAQGQAGVARNYLFDDYWPGSTQTSTWKNVISFLTEGASAKVASPVFVEPNEIRVNGKGLSEYKKSINMPLPWPGGWWRLGDLVQYEITSTMSILETASHYRKDILMFRNDLCRKEVNNGKTIPPFYYILPLRQHDRSELVSLVNLLKEHGIEVYRLTAPLVIDNCNYDKGDIVVPLAQPFRPFIKEVMEAQQYPLRHYTPDGLIMKPYDITSWSLPLHKGITAVEITRREAVPGNFDAQLEKIDGPFNFAGPVPQNYVAALFTVNHNESFKAAFMALSKGLKVQRLKKAVPVDGESFPAGSFIIYRNETKNNTLNELLQQMTVSPKILMEPLNLDEQEVSPLKMPRIGLVETYFHDMEAGWTRFILDSYFIPYTVVHPGDFESTDFIKNYDVLIFPGANKTQLMEGKQKDREDGYEDSNYPPQYAKGMGKKGLGRVMSFLDNGGIIVSWGRSTEIFMGPQEIPPVQKTGEKEEFLLPVLDISDQLKKDGLYCPGSLLNVSFLKDHPLTWGMPEETGVFFRGEPVFRTRVPKFDMDRRVIGTFPGNHILLSGYCEKEEKLANQTALAWFKKNKGQLVLFAFAPQFRASTNGTFKLLFNAILLEK